MSDKTTIRIDVDVRESIRIDVDVRESLKEIGNKGDSYNDVICSLVAMYKYSKVESKKIRDAQ
jgi:predicted CopG family antitoxin